MTKYNSSELDNAALRAAQDRFARAENPSSELPSQPPTPPAPPAQAEAGGAPSLGQALESQAPADNEAAPPAHNPPSTEPEATPADGASVEREPASRAGGPPLYHPAPEAPRHATPDTPAAANPPSTSPAEPPRPGEWGQPQPGSYGTPPAPPQRPSPTPPPSQTPPPPPNWPQRPSGFGGGQERPDTERTQIVRRDHLYPAPGNEWPRPPQSQNWPARDSYPAQPGDPGPDTGYGQQLPPGSAPEGGYGQQQPRGGFAATPRPAAPFTPASDRGADRSFTLQSQRREGPQQGWRAALHRMHIPVGKSAAETEYDLDISKINKVLRYPKAIGFAALKGGVGKTVCAMSIASTIAEHRQKGEVVALDTDHSGSLSRRVRGDQISDIKRFVADDALHSTNDVKAHMQSNHHRLSVLGSSREPLATALTPEEYLRAKQVLQAGHLFTVVDMDHSAASPAYETIMRSLDALVVVTATSLDSAEASQDIMDWLRARQMNELLTRTVVLINHQSPAKPHLDLDATVSHFRNSEQHDVLEIPWDEHLAEAGPINLDLLNKTTRRQFVKVAAMLVDSLPAT